MTIDSPPGERLVSDGGITLTRWRLGVLLCGLGTEILGTVLGKSEKPWTEEAAISELSGRRRDGSRAIRYM